MHESDANAAVRMNQSNGAWIDMVYPSRLVFQDLLRVRLSQLNKRTALGRMGTSEDVANLVSYLISEEANFMTGDVDKTLRRLIKLRTFPYSGQTISLNGGSHMD